MSMNWEAAQNSGPASGNWGRRCGPRWKAIEIVAMVLGFIVFWPIGLAIVAFKIWQHKTGYAGDLASFCRETAGAFKSGDYASGPFSRASWPSFSGWGCRGSRNSGRRRGAGNSAFDEWRDAELARLEEERRKLEAAEKEFADYMQNLRRARDREEFDRFMRDRQARNAGPDAQPNG